MHLHSAVTSCDCIVTECCCCGGGEILLLCTGSDCGIDSQL